MDKELIERHTDKINIICKNWGIPYQDREDCIQWIFLKRVEGKNRHQLVSHAVVDWMRHYYVDKRHKDRKNALKFAMPREYDPKTDGRLQEQAHDNSEFFRIVSLLENPKSQGLVIRVFYWGDMQKEIAEELGITQSAISLRLKRVLEELFLALKVEM